MRIFSKRRVFFTHPLIYINETPLGLYNLLHIKIKGKVSNILHTHTHKPVLCEGSDLRSVFPGHLPTFPDSINYKCSDISKNLELVWPLHRGWWWTFQKVLWETVPHETVPWVDEVWLQWYEHDWKIIISKSIIAFDRRTIINSRGGKSRLSQYLILLTRNINIVFLFSGTKTPKPKQYESCHSTATAVFPAV